MDFVVHTASPVGTGTRNHDEMIIPAVSGVRLVVQAAIKNKVKRVVITSSVAAVRFPAPAEDDHEYDESSWTDIVTADFSPYLKSKTLAEREAWAIQEKCKKAGEYCPEIVTICPSMIFGETFCSGGQTSVEVVRKMVMNEFTFGYPALRLNCVDVKDCAKAHIRGMEIPEAADKRFILSIREDYAIIDLAN